MLCFDQGHRRFNYRIVGVAIHDGAVLLHRTDRESFWTLPGGRGEHGESAEETLAREMREELDTEIHVDRLLWLVENFFDYDGLSYHELALYFLIRFPDGSTPRRAESFDRREGDVLFRFRWFQVQPDELRRLPLFPEFLPEGLSNLPPATVHIVERETGRTASDHAR